MRVKVEEKRKHGEGANNGLRPAGSVGILFTQEEVLKPNIEYRTRNIECRSDRVLQLL